MKYNGTSWVNVGTAGFSASDAEFQSLAFYNGEPYVAYMDYGNSKKNTVMRYGAKIVGNSPTYVATTVGRYQLKVTNASGNISYDTVMVSIGTNTTFTDVQTGCDSLIWIDGNIYTASNITATHTLINTTGCDSVVRLNLTIDNVSDITTTSTVDNIITANNTNATYQWLDCNNGNEVIPGATSATYIATTNGSYAVELTENNNNCTDTSECVKITTVEVIENNFSSKITVFPNPTEGAISIDLGVQYSEVLITLTYLSGKLIESEIFSNQAQLKFQLEASNGVCLLNIKADGKESLVRLIKQ